MKIYDFTRLIDKYKCSFTLTYTAEGGYDGGIYVEGQNITTELTGAIVPLAARKLYQSGGTYHSQDRQLYMHTALPNSLLSGKVQYQDHTYTVEEDTNYGEYADVYVYLLRRVD